jgi:hypothetical protein
LLRHMQRPPWHEQRGRCDCELYRNKQAIVAQDDLAYIGWALET